MIKYPATFWLRFDKCLYSLRSLQPFHAIIVENAATDPSLIYRCNMRGQTHPELLQCALLLLMVVAQLTGVELVESASTTQRLTTSCEGHCDPFTLCIVQNTTTADNMDQSVEYLCLSQSPSREKNDSLFITIETSGENKTKSAQVSVGADNKLLVSNKTTTAISVIDLSPSISHFTLTAKSALDDIARAKKNCVELGPDFTISAPQAIDISLINIVLSSAVTRFPSPLPATTTQLRLEKGMLTEFPTIVLLPLRSLLHLNLDFNNIEDVGLAAFSGSIVSLSLQGNEMHSFRGYFPQLRSLSLARNSFSVIPESIFGLKRLRTLNMRGNSQLSRNFTTAQANFLRNISWDLKEEDFVELDFCESGLQQIHGVNVCITDVAATTTSYLNNGNLNNDKVYKSQGGVDLRRRLYGYEGPVCPGYYSGGVLAGSIIGTVVFMLIVGALVWRWQMQKQKTDKPGKPTKTSDEGYMSVWHDPQLLKLQLKVEDIQDVRKIGGGAYADVWLVKYRGTQLLASKRLRKEHETRQYMQSFAKEIKMVATFDHPSIVKLVGAAWTIESDLQALSEYMVGGDVREFLIYPQTPRSWTARKLQIAKDVIEALVYVHSFAPPIVHRDLKSRNILLSREMRAKLTDFGVSRFMSEDNTMTQGVGTSRWEAPEVLAGKDDYNQAADIFSFGVVLSELDTHSIPYDDARGPSDNPLANVAILQMIAMGAIRPSLSTRCPPDIRALANRCLAYDPDDRPSAPEVAYALRTATI